MSFCWPAKTGHANAKSTAMIAARKTIGLQEALRGSPICITASTSQRGTTALSVLRLGQLLDRGRYRSCRSVRPSSSSTLIQLLETPFRLKQSGIGVPCIEPGVIRQIWSFAVFLRPSGYAYGDEFCVLPPSRQGDAVDINGPGSGSSSLPQDVGSGQRNQGLPTILEAAPRKGGRCFRVNSKVSLQQAVEKRFSCP
jgi:hypothetical protein